MTDLTASLDRIRSKFPVGVVEPEPFDCGESVRDYLVDRQREGAAALWADEIPRRFHTARLADITDVGTHTALSGWVTTRPTNSTLLIAGPVGTGKTHAAVAVCRELAFATDGTYGLSYRFCPTVQLLDKLRPGGEEDAWDQMTTVDLLVVDDLGTEKESEWVQERLFGLINHRYNHELATVLTTNLMPEALQKGIGERSYSRIVGDGATVVRIAGEDRRRKKAS